MKLKFGCLLCSSVLLIPLSASAQLSIDATGEHKETKRTATASCGSIGRKLSVQVAVRFPAGLASAKGKTIAEFTLTNSGREHLSIPISPDPDQVEPDSDAYSLRWLSVHITSCSSKQELPCANRIEQFRIKGGAQLYGSEDSSTLLLLAPGESVLIQAEVSLTPNADRNGTAIYVAHAMLSDEQVTTIAGKKVRKCVGVGVMSATSGEYTLEAMLK